jgi:hypothetical protein
MVITNTTPYLPLARTIVPSIGKLVSFVWKDQHVEELKKLFFANDKLVTTFKAAQAARRLQADQPATIGAFDFIATHLPAPAWRILDGHWAEIVALPCSAMIMRELLKGVETYRQNFALLHKFGPELDAPWRRMYAMIEKIARAAEVELDAYDELERQRHEAKRKRQKFTADYKGKRPADIYRRYGLALRYAVEFLGSFRAKRALNALMLSVTIPVDELENPAWVDSYTGEGDPDYEFLRVRELKTDYGSGADAVSSDGNLPVVVADLIENLGGQKKDFQDTLQRMGMTLNDYWKQFLEAQRSGFTMAPEIGEQAFDDDTDSIEKDFEFKADLMVDQGTVDIIKSRMEKELRTVKELMEQTASEVAALRDMDRAYKHLGVLIAAHKPNMGQVARGVIQAELYNLVQMMIAEIVVIKTRYEKEFMGEEHPLLEGPIKNLSFKYPVDTTKTSLGYLMELLGKKKKAIFGITWDMARVRFFGNWNVKTLISTFSGWGVEEVYEPKDLMAALLPYQNAYGFREDDEEDELAQYFDLSRFRIHWKWGGNLHAFMEQHGEIFLEQFTTGGGAGIVASADPDGDTLEHWTNDVVAERQRTLLSKNGAKVWRLVYAGHTGTAAEKKAVADQWFTKIYSEERAAELEHLKAIGIKPNQRNNREFIEAEVEAAILGDGGKDGPQQAGWDAYRQKIDPEANMAFKRELKLQRNAGKGISEATVEAMKVFWVEVDRNKNRLDHPDKNGLVLRSGRHVDWGIVKLKLDKGEIPTNAQEMRRLLKYLENNKYATWFQVYLHGYIQRMEKAEQPA